MSNACVYDESEPLVLSRPKPKKGQFSDGRKLKTSRVNHKKRKKRQVRSMIYVSSLYRCPGPHRGPFFLAMA